MESPVSPEDVDALEARTRNLLATARGPYSTGTDVGTLYIFDDANGSCVAEAYDVDENGPLLAASWDLAQQNLTLIKEVRSLQEAIRRQAAAVRMSETARQQIDAYERKTLTSLAGQERAALLEEVAAAREEASRWNAEATRLEGERDALVDAIREEQRARNVIASVPHFTPEFFQGVRDHREAVTALKTVLSPYKKTRRSPRKEPPTMPEPVVSTQEDCAKHCDELAANCYAFARNVGMMGDHNEAIDARRTGDTYADIARRIRAITALTPKEPTP